jgi:hypothetical protein
MDYWWKLFSAYFLFLCLARRHFSTPQWMSSQKSSTAKNFFLLGPPHFSSFWLEGWQRFGYWLFNMETNAAAAATKQIQQMLEMQARAFVFLVSWSWANRKTGKRTIVNSIFISFFEKMKKWRKKILRHHSTWCLFKKKWRGKIEREFRADLACPSSN